MKKANEWTQTVKELEAISAEIRHIHETPSKDQTPAQLSALDSLRRQAQAIGDKRYAILKMKDEPVAAIRNLPVTLKGHAVTIGQINVGSLPDGRAIQVTPMPQVDGRILWKVSSGLQCASYVPADLTQFDLAWEPSPSSRTPEWLANYRFPTLEEAMLTACYVADHETKKYWQALTPIIAAQVHQKAWDSQ